ncbi:MAG: transposase [Nitrospiraceae bacterium]
MSERRSELRVIHRNRDGRRRFDAAAKQALVEAALHSGVSVARLAQQHEVNANLLRKWITKYLLARGSDAAAAPQAERLTDQESPRIVEVIADAKQGAFIPAVSISPPVMSPRTQEPAAIAVAPSAMLHVRLPNGAEFDLAQAAGVELETIVQMLGRMTCSSSTKA